MQVFKIETPILALALLAVADGNNFDELSAEVADIGGSAELVNDGLARVQVNGRTYDLPIGYVLVFDGSYGRLISKGQFDEEYVLVGASEFDLHGFVERVSKLEAEVEKLTKAGTSKTKTDKTEKTEPA